MHFKLSLGKRDSERWDTAHGEVKKALKGQTI